MTLYPSVDEVLAAHARLIAVFGGAQGIRDRGALEAALARPQSGYYEDIIQQAAALLESLSENHPFVDGNKRYCHCGDRDVSPHKRVPTPL